MSIAGSHTNGTMEDPDSSRRDIKAHMLFEISTEVANRGERCYCTFERTADFAQLGESTLSSSQKHR